MSRFYSYLIKRVEVIPWQVLRKCKYYIGSVCEKCHTRQKLKRERWRGSRVSILRSLTRKSCNVPRMGNVTD